MASLAVRRAKGLIFYTSSTAGRGGATSSPSSTGQAGPPAPGRPVVTRSIPLDCTR